VRPLAASTVGAGGANRVGAEAARSQAGPATPTRPGRRGCARCWRGRPELRAITVWQREHAMAGCLVRCPGSPPAWSAARREFGRRRWVSGCRGR
jgi:hypothetical protein